VDQETKASDGLVIVGDLVWKLKTATDGNGSPGRWLADINSMLAGGPVFGALAGSLLLGGGRIMGRDIA
jgi:hypothetical protein